jgi:hypothetical protein
LKENFSNEIKKIFNNSQYEVAFVIFHNTNSKNSISHFNTGDNNKKISHRDLYHVDTILPNTIKVLIYLSDNVNEENGAFRYVPGSYLYNQSPEDWITRYVTRHYYHSTNKESLKRFYSLDRKYQKRAHFLYCNNNEKYKNDIDSKAFIFKTPTNMIMFNANGIHNGGFVYKGNRKALQILLKLKD